MLYSVGNIYETASYHAIGIAYNPRTGFSLSMYQFFRVVVVVVWPTHAKSSAHIIFFYIRHPSTFQICVFCTATNKRLRWKRIMPAFFFCLSFFLWHRSFCDWLLFFGGEIFVVVVVCLFVCCCCCSGVFRESPLAAERRIPMPESEYTRLRVDSITSGSQIKLLAWELFSFFFLKGGPKVNFLIPREIPIKDLEKERKSYGKQNRGKAR